MKKLLLIPILILLMYFVAQAAVIQKPPVSPNREIHKIIAYDVGKLIQKFIKENDFSKDYSEKYYKPLLDSMARKVESYNRETIKKYENKIRATSFQVRGNSNINHKPLWIFVSILFTDGDFWQIRIPIRENYKIKKGYNHERVF